MAAGGAPEENRFVADAILSDGVRNQPEDAWKEMLQLSNGKMFERAFANRTVMANGADKNWFRLRTALEGFFVMHGHWPSRVRLPFVFLENLRTDLFTRVSWERLTERIEFVADESAGLIAEDEAGNAYNYG